MSKEGDKYVARMRNKTSYYQNKFKRKAGIRRKLKPKRLFCCLHQFSTKFEQRGGKGISKEGNPKRSSSKRRKV
jgi:hypothetical protein